MSRLLVIAIAAIVIIGGGIGAFALTHRPGSPTANTTGTTTPGPKNTPTLSATTIATTGNTPITNNSPIALGSGTAIPACANGLSHTGNFSFTGAVSGAMVVALFFACDTTNSSGKRQYVADATGTIGSKEYTLIFGINSYTGPGTYNSSTANEVAELAVSGSQDAWVCGNGIPCTSTMTVHSDGLSGTMQATMILAVPTPNPSSFVTVSGTWSQ